MIKVFIEYILNLCIENIKLHIKVFVYIWDELGSTKKCGFSRKSIKNLWPL